MRDRKLEKYGSGYRSAGSSRSVARSGGTQPKPMPKKKDGPSALDIVKGEIEKKYGKGAIMDTSKKKNEEVVTEKKKGLWDNIHAKRKRGEKPAKPGDKDYPKTLNVEGYGAPGHNPGSGEKSVARAKALMDKQGRKGAPGLDAMAAAKKEHEARRGVKKEEVEVEEGYDEPKMHSAVKRVMTTQPAAKGRAASRLHSKYSMRSKGNVAGETDGPGPNAPKRSGRKGRGSETDRGSGNAAKRRMSTEALDPVGKEDGDVNNDGKKDSTDSYLMKRRKAIGSAMKKRLKEERASLSEVMTDKEEDKKVTEKKVDNKIVINPKLSEAVDEIGGEVLEMVEVEEMMEPQTDEPKKKDTEISSKERRLQQVKKQIAMKKLQAIRQGDQNVMSSHEPEGDMIDERTRYAKETGKDFTTGKPSERGGTRPGNTFDKVKSELRKTGGVMSDRGKAIQPQGKKKVPGKKGYQGTTPVDRIRNRLAQQRAAKPNPYRARAGESD